LAVERSLVQFEDDSRRGGWLIWTLLLERSGDRFDFVIMPFNKVNINMFFSFEKLIGRQSVQLLTSSMVLFEPICQKQISYAHCKTRKKDVAA